ncbi:SOS response-associated peptidase [Gilvimarinus sp. F26214L]|uniref:SOS response-associated peptidase n=1 Tax=Gilvimarinus sp. DZF01 TaxID=3461371 RepID=UPI0040464F09
MCGRYLLRTPPHAACQPPWDAYWRDISAFIPRFNICPGERSPVVLRREGRTACEPLFWGFKPSWSKYQPVINARAESVLQSRMFRDSARYRRCLVMADGFYEPKGPAGARKRPWYLFEYDDGRGFAFAGIWTGSGFSIITCEANDRVRPVHDRMPLILDPTDWQGWLDEDQDDGAIEVMLEPGEYPGLVYRPVSDYAKKPGNEGPQCVAPVASA